MKSPVADRASRVMLMDVEFQCTLKMFKRIIASRENSVSSLLSKRASTNHAISDGENGSGYNKSVLMRKNSSKNNLPQSSLMDEMVRLAQDHSKYKLIIDTIKGEYEESKTYEIIRRYGRLKGMIKRTILYTKLGTLPDISCALGMGGLMMLHTGVNRWQGIDQLHETPKSEIPDRIALLKRRISLIRHQIESLSDSYEASKRYAVFQRYRLMKSMIKELLSNCDDT